MFENTFCKLWHADCLLIVQTQSGSLTVFYRIAIEISVYQNESCVNDALFTFLSSPPPPTANQNLLLLYESLSFIIKVIFIFNKLITFINI